MKRSWIVVGSLVLAGCSTHSAVTGVESAGGAGTVEVRPAHARISPGIRPGLVPTEARFFINGQPSDATSITDLGLRMEDVTSVRVLRPVGESGLIRVYFVTDTLLGVGSL